MRRSATAILADALAATESIESIVSGATRDEYLATRMLRSAVEREFLIVGEALNALDSLTDDARDRVTNLGRIVGMRNRLAHAYDLIDDAMTWSIACDAIPALRRELQEWLESMI